MPALTMPARALAGDNRTSGRAGPVELVSGGGEKITPLTSQFLGIYGNAKALRGSFANAGLPQIQDEHKDGEIPRVSRDPLLACRK